MDDVIDVVSSLYVSKQDSRTHHALPNCKDTLVSIQNIEWFV
jgi:hypothetical protein